MVHIDLSYQGKLHCQAVHGPSGAILETDAPVDNHGLGQSFSPTDLVATALAACMATVIGIIGQRKGIVLDGMKISARKIMSSEPPRRIKSIELDLSMPLSAEHPERALLENAAVGCPVHQSLHPDLEVVMHWQWNG
ncbi:MAG: OsmC family peroxiredoxin [Verrucomicrobia bacterium]|nr:MAG: OsmC family peroxiredoxin [Verrucomicrobiota bacterium]